MSRFAKTNGESRPPVLNWQQCFAKSTDDGGPGISVADHCMIAGLLAERLVCLHSGALFPEGTSFFVSSHDAGKVSPGFQKKYFTNLLVDRCPELAESSTEARGWETNHAVIGEAAFCKWAEDHARSRDWLKWAESIGAHHGCRKNPNREGTGPYGGKEWAGERQELLNVLFKQFGERLPDASPRPEQIKLLAGLTCVSDWIASNEDFFPNNGIPAGTDVSLQIEQALRECGWTAPQFKPGLSFRQVFPFPPNGMQQAFVDCVNERGVYVLEAPMGMGKTEAALFAAYKLMASGQNSGLYFGLPTRLTSDRIHRRVEEFMERILENPSFIKLIHGHAWMNLESHAKEFDAGMSWFHPRKRALLAPFGVGTIDQALMSVLKVKHHFVRTFGLAGKVVILDEVHSYDAYTGTLLNCLVEELLKIGCSVIILSATLTEKRRRDFVEDSECTEAYPLISAQARSVEPPPPENKEFALRVFKEPDDRLVGQAVSAAEQGLCVLWIANTVAQSQEIFNRINGTRAEGSFKTGLLHSRFPVFRRTELEDDWMEKLGKDGCRPSGCILVATQVVEQSVDIDADLLISDLSPTDMLLQRMGRLCRHERGARPDGAWQAWLYGPFKEDPTDAESFKSALGPSQYVYSPYVLWKTIQVWKNRPAIRLPSEIRDVLEATYADEQNPPDWVVELKAELDAKKAKLQGAALGLTQIFCGDDDEERAPTRYSTRATIQTLILQQCDDCDKFADIVLCDETDLRLTAGERDFKKAVAVHQNMVSLPIHQSLKLPVPAWLAKMVFGPAAVLKLDGENLRDINGDDVPWGYHKDKGIYARNIEFKKPSQWELEDEDESYY